MKFKISVLVFLLLIFVIGICFAIQPMEKDPIPPLTERISILYENSGIYIICIDGYKWIFIGNQMRQAWKIDNKGNPVPARCDE